MIISTVIEEFVKSNRYFWQFLSKRGKERSLLNLTTGIFGKTTPNIIFISDERLKAFPTRSRGPTRESTFTTSVHHRSGDSEQCTEVREGNKRHAEVKPALSQAT